MGLNFINSLRPVEFRLKNDNKGLDIGFIAQDIENLLGTAYNLLGVDEDEDQTLSRWLRVLNSGDKSAPPQRGGLISGIYRKKEIPFPGVLSTSTAPWWFVMVP